MILIQRTPCPGCLEHSPGEENAYRKREVVKALWEMQHEKCCYSETLLPAHGHGKAVEHFQPKSIFRWRKNDWSNLLLVCPQCNGRKRDLFPVMMTDNEDETNVLFVRSPTNAKKAILDPSDPLDDPEAHLTYVLDDRDSFYGQVIPKNNSTRGRLTIEVTGIDDHVFLKERVLRLIETLDVQYRSVLRAKVDQDDDALNARLTEFSGYLRSNAKFAGLARAYARYKKLDQRFGISIPGPVSP